MTWRVLPGPAGVDVAGTKAGALLRRGVNGRSATRPQAFLSWVSMVVESRVFMPFFSVAQFGLMDRAVVMTCGMSASGSVGLDWLRRKADMAAYRGERANTEGGCSGL